MITPVILSGGSGTRLWPLSTAERPKQFLHLAGDHTLLEATANRVSDPSLFGPAIVVSGAAHAAAAEAQVERLGRLIIEPAARNTAPAIALAALAAKPEDLLLVLPSDHVILDPQAFRRAVQAGQASAEKGWLVTFGIRAEHPETGYGYIKRGAAMDDGLFEVERFVEKPSAEVASSYVESGDYDWNGGIFLFRAAAFLDSLRVHAPDMFAAIQKAMAEARFDGPRIHPDAARFRASPSQSIDYAVMEKAEQVAVVPVSMGWSDVGCWDALYEVATLDSDGNALAGDVLAIDSHDCLLRSEGPKIAAIGVHDLIVVAAGDAILVLPRGESQRVKEIVARLKDDDSGA